MQSTITMTNMLCRPGLTNLGTMQDETSLKAYNNNSPSAPIRFEAPSLARRNMNVAKGIARLPKLRHVLVLARYTPRPYQVWNLLRIAQSHFAIPRDWISDPQIFSSFRWSTARFMLRGRCLAVGLLSLSQDGLQSRHARCISVQGCSRACPD